MKHFLEDLFIKKKQKTGSNLNLNICGSRQSTIIIMARVVLALVCMAGVSASSPAQQHELLTREQVDGLSGLLNESCAYIVGKMSPNVVSWD